METYEKELSTCRLNMQGAEARVKSLQESMKEGENRKRALEETVDALQEECAKLKAQGWCLSTSCLVPWLQGALNKLPDQLFSFNRANECCGK